MANVAPSGDLYVLLVLQNVLAFLTTILYLSALSSGRQEERNFQV
jgi:hypothetical protein